MKRMVVVIGMCATLSFVLAVQAQAPREYTDIMKDVGRQFQALVRGLDGQDTTQVSADARKMGALFKETHEFWARRKSQDAMGWASTNEKLSNDMAAAASSGKWDDAGKLSETISKNCKSCHDAYRERGPDGKFRIKGGM